MSHTLRLDIVSYQFCTLDDSWIEAAHRDVSGLAKKKANFGIAACLAHIRVKQNLALVDSASQAAQTLFFTTMMPGWKAIARPAYQVLGLPMAWATACARQSLPAGG